MLERSEEKNESVLGRAVLVAAESKVELSCPAAETERKLPAFLFLPAVEAVLQGDRFVSTRVKHGGGIAPSG